MTASDHHIRPPQLTTIATATPLTGIRVQATHPPVTVDGMKVISRIDSATARATSSPVAAA
ncbi:hypothetical protein [Streptomyces sp. WM6378]|uniref:hypothetical protein n=1 Tax=Streptomyces sp. WM6378 TaxID=1415557 RepID=UPI000A6B4311|nr:hypothetical protein [Streptomyces sp. WM6378]